MEVSSKLFHSTAPLLRCKQDNFGRNAYARSGDEVQGPIWTSRIPPSGIFAA